MAFRLPRPDRQAKVVDDGGRASLLEQRWRQSFAKKIEGQEDSQDDILTQLAAVQADIVTALENAGIALARANSVMPDIPPVTVLYDYTGTVLDGQLPRNIAATRLNDTTDVTTDSVWSATTISGDATYTIGAATGVLNLTAPLNSTATIEVTSVYNTISRSKRVLVQKLLQDPPSASSTTTSYDSSILPTNSATYGSANAGPVTITCGASGNVDLTAPLDFYNSVATTDDAWGKWQVSLAGAGAWSDVDTEIQSIVSARQSDSADGDTGVILVNQTATGLTPATDYDFQLLLRNGAGTDTLNYYGTATATTS